jgi:DNA-binding CsgD family transcriptional regulator
VPTVPTRPAGPGRDLPHVTPAQRRLLEALRGDGAVPASNREIAERLGISVDTVKGTLSVLYERFGLEHLPQNAKRAALAALSDSRSE